ncbi:hypothetical protein C8Q74DRAFT_1180263, partial [Fomes fomentarius]
RPQAGPLPAKRGELGFREGVHDIESQASSSTINLPERHPADRDRSASPEADATPNHPPRSPSRAESTQSAGKRSLISFFKPKRIPTVVGLRVTTLVLFIFQLALLAGTLAGWVMVTKRVQRTAAAAAPPSPSSDPSDDDRGKVEVTSQVFNTTSAQIFVHVAFGIVSLAELIFLERSLFRLRAERYAYVHPGEILPRSGRRPSQEATIAFAPWNRPPLPTYAAALAQSGVGTGDVEDNIIAIPPPPAYGNTRGSRLLLAGFLPETLRGQRPRSDASTQSRGSERSRRSASGGDGEDDRPKSYMSTDPEWEARCDADRALVLEETLARLEE